MNLALFDFDGTITNRELFADFVRFALPPARLAAAWRRLAPWVLGYRLGLISGTRIRSRVAEVGFGGLSEEVVHEAGRRFADAVIPSALRPEAMARIEWHRGRGDTVVVVSGAFDFYLGHWCRSHGLDVLCSSLESEDGRLTGRYRGAQCVGAEKARRVRATYDLARYRVIHAYGDTREDAELLALAHRKVFRWRELA